MITLDDPMIIQRTL